MLSSGVRKDDTDLSPFGGLRGGRNVPHQRIWITSAGGRIVYYLVVAGGRGSVVDVCSSLKEAERSCRQHQRVVGGSFWVKTADDVGEKWN